MNKVVLKGHILVPEEDLPQVLSELPTHIELTRKEAGCIVFDVTQDESDKRKFHVYEEFHDEASFNNHQLRASASKWSQITSNVERFYNVEGLSK